MPASPHGIGGEADGAARRLASRSALPAESPRIGHAGCQSAAVPRRGGAMAAARWMLRWVAAAAAAVAAVLALDNGLARTPPMGWLHWERFLCATDCAAEPHRCVRYRRGARGARGSAVTDSRPGAPAAAVPSQSRAAGPVLRPPLCLPRAPPAAPGRPAPRLCRWYTADVLRFLCRWCRGQRAAVRGDG